MRKVRKMNTLWPDFSFEMYKRACDELNYPEEPFSKYINEFIKEDDVVADIGCGIGIPAMYISKRCKRVIAIDNNKESLDYFNKEIIKNDIKNIEIVHGAWPTVELEPCDVAIAFYVSKIADSKESLAALVNAVKHGGMITSRGSNEDDGFYNSLATRLGVPSRSYGCSNGCYLRGRLEMLGCKVKCEQISHEFGQPVNDIDEAAKFIWWQLQLDSSYLEQIKMIAGDYIINRNGKLYIPKLRSSCLIIFEK
jgi:SAM-dependent methyltransferase